MSTNKLVFNGNSHECLSFVKKNLVDFGPVKKATCFFCEENFWLLPQYSPEPGTHLILTNSSGAQMELSSLNCGYGGTGPSSTARVLVLLGVEKETAELWKWNPGYSVDFSSKPAAFSKEMIFFQPDFHQNGPVLQCCLGNEIRSEPEQRRLLMFNPHHNHLRDLLNCIEIMDLYEMEYWWNVPATEAQTMSLDDALPYTERFSSCFKSIGTDYCNLILRGERFKIFCFVSPHDLLLLVEILHLAIKGTALHSRAYAFPPFFLMGNSINDYSFFERVGLWTKTLFNLKNKCFEHKKISISKRQQRPTITR